MFTELPGVNALVGLAIAFVAAKVSYFAVPMDLIILRRLATLAGPAVPLVLLWTLLTPVRLRHLDMLLIALTVGIYGVLTSETVLFRGAFLVLDVMLLIALKELLAELANGHELALLTGWTEFKGVLPAAIVLVLVAFQFAITAEDVACNIAGPEPTALDISASVCARWAGRHIALAIALPGVLIPAGWMMWVVAKDWRKP